MKDSDRGMLVITVKNDRPNCIKLTTPNGEEINIHVSRSGKSGTNQQRVTFDAPKSIKIKRVEIERGDLH